MFIFRLIVGVSFNAVIFGVLLFIPAGTLRWWRAWVFLGVVVASAVTTMLAVFRSRPDLLDERFKPPIQKGQPVADRIVLLLLLTSFCSLVAFIPLDVFRFHLMRKPGMLVSSSGLVLFVAGWWIMSLALKENTFAAPVVRFQEERRHTVISTGVYGVVRHPMYLGAVAVLTGMPLWLESYAAALLAALPIATLVLRIRIEERFLSRELQGYEAYRKRTRYRLIPLLW
jgi:protein-S-isoprenylcysteine O-methyltransferase Ste14